MSREGVACSEAWRFGADECEVYWCRYFERMGYYVSYYGGNNPRFDMLALRFDSRGRPIEVIYIEVKSGTGAHLTTAQRELYDAFSGSLGLRMGYNWNVKARYAVCRCDCDYRGRCKPLNCEYA